MSPSPTRARSVKKKKTARTRPEWTQRVGPQRTCRALIHATRLSYAAQTIYLTGPEPRTALDYATSLYTALEDTVKIVVEFATESTTSLSRSCEKRSNSALNSVKAKDIRTNATDVENRKNIAQTNLHHGLNITTGTTCGRNGLMFSRVFKCFTQLFPALQSF